MERISMDAHTSIDSSIPAKVCDICGDPGFEEMLATCSECSLRAEHIYCMQTLKEAVVPENAWVCECCKLRKELKHKDLPNSVLPSMPGCSDLFKSKTSHENQSARLAGVEKSKVSLNQPAGLDDLTSATPAERIASDVLKVPKNMPNLGGVPSIQQSVGLAESRQILSKQNSLKVPNISKVKCLSTIRLADNSKSGKATVNVAGRLSRKSSTIVAISSPKTDSVLVGSPKVNRENSSSLITKVVGAAENPERHEAAMPVFRTSSSGSFLQNKPAKHMVSPKSLYEDLPPFLISSPKILKRQALPSKKTPGGVYSLQVRQKLLAGCSVPTYSTGPKKYLSQKISPETHHSDCVEISIDRNVNKSKVPEHKLLPDTSSINPFAVDQKMCTSINTGQASCTVVPPGENTTGSTNTCGDPCAANSERQADALQLNPSKSLVDAPCSWNSGKCESKCLVKASAERLVEMSACLGTSYIKVKATEEGTPLLPETSKFRAKSCMQSTYKDDSSNLMNVATNITPATAGSTISVQNIDTMVVATKDSIAEREAKIAHRAGISEMNVMDEEEQQPKCALRSWCSNPVLSLERTRRYKRQEMAHSSQINHRFSNNSSPHLQNPGGSPTVNELHVDNVPFSCVNATNNTVVACRTDPKVLEPADIPSSLVGEYFSAKTTNPSSGRLSNLENLQMREKKMKVLDFSICQEAAIQSSSGNSLEKAIFLEKDKEDHSVIGVSDVCKPHLMTSLESNDPLQCGKFDNVHAAQTAGKNLVNLRPSSVRLSHCTPSIVIPETLSMQVDYSKFMKAPDMASCVPMGRLPAGESGCSNIADARKIVSEKGTIDLDVENVRTVPFPRHANFAVTCPRFPAIPEPSHLWRGSFQVIANGKSSSLYDGIEAHASSRAMDKVYHATRGFPSVLQLEEVQRGDATDSWPMQFMMKPPNDESIALYFFATNNHSFEQYYRRLLDHMVVHDLALKGATDAAELLIFPSSLLPKQFQCWNRLMFLWGVFRGKKRFKVENMSCAVHPDLGGLQVSNVLPSLKPHVAKGSITEVLPVAMSTVMSNDDVAGEEDMDVDMEGGKEVGIADWPVKKPVPSNPEPTSSKIDILSAFPQVSQAQQVSKALKQDTANEIPAKKSLARIFIAADPYHSYEKVNKLGEVDLPPGFGPLTPAAIFPDQPPVFEKCNKITDKEHLNTGSVHAASRGDEEGSLKRSYAKTQHSPPSSPKEKVYKTGHVESRSHRNRYSSSGSESPRFHKRRKTQEKLPDRDQLDISKCAGRPKCRHRKESAYKVDKEMEKRNRRDYWGRYCDYDRKNYEIRAHRENHADYCPKERKLRRDSVYVRRHKKFYSCSHSRSPSQSCSHFKRKDRSCSPCYSYRHKSEKSKYRHRSELGTAILGSSPEEDFVKLQQTEVKRGELQGVSMGVQAGLKRELGGDPINKASRSEQGSSIKKLVIHDIIGGEVEVKDKPARRRPVPLKVVVTNVCDSSHNDLAMTKSATKELTSSSENKQLLQPSKVTAVHLSTLQPSKVTAVHLSSEEEASQGLTIASEISSAAEESFCPCYPPVMTVATSSEHAEPGVGKLEIGWHLTHAVGKTPLEGETEIFEDEFVASNLELTLGGNESDQVEPLSLFNEQVGLMKEKCDFTSSYQSAPYAAKCSSMRGTLNFYGLCEDKFGSLNLTLAAPGRTSMEGGEKDSLLQAVDISLKL